MGLFQKVILDQFDEAYNLADKPMEHMNLSTELPELNSIDLHRTGSEESYDLAFYFHLSGKNLICQVMQSKHSEDIIFKNRWIYDKFLFILISIMNIHLILFVINYYCCSSSFL
jgi:hypothetical protein